MATFLYRRGDGNEGNFPRYMVTLGDTDDAYALLKALVANDYIAGRKVRRHIVRSIEVDGEFEFGLHASVYEGPDGERAFDAAWLTAELQPLTQEDIDFYADRATSTYSPKQVLDASAWRMYRKASKD